MDASSHSQDKAQRILDAVRKILVQNGYAATTIALVAQEAGVSRGLLHYYFRNKEEMLAKVLKANMESNVPLLESIFRQSDSIEAFSGNLVQALKLVMEHNPDYFDLFFEGLAVARQSMIVQSELEAQHAKFQDAMCSGLEFMVSKGLIGPGLPVKGMASLITGIVDGMALQFVTVSSVMDDEEIWESMRRSLNLLLQSDWPASP